MTKVYELINYKACSISVVYLGVRVPIEFVAGRGSGPSANATFTTSSRFVQDALEHDERYCKMYRCVAVHQSERDNMPQPSSVQVAAKKGKRLSSAQKRALAQQNAVGMMEKPIDATIEPEDSEPELEAVMVGPKVTETNDMENPAPTKLDGDQNPPAPKTGKARGVGKQSAKTAQPQQEGPVFKDPNEAFAFDFIYSSFSSIFSKSLPISLMRFFSKSRS